MLYPIPVLNEIVSGQKVFGIIISDVLQRTIFPVFGIETVHDGHSYLNVGVIDRISLKDKVTFQFSDSADTDVVTFGPCVYVYNIFQHRAVIDPLIRIQSKIES